MSLSHLQVQFFDIASTGLLLPVVVELDRLTTVLLQLVLEVVSLQLVLEAVPRLKRNPPKDRPSDLFPTILLSRITAHVSITLHNVANFRSTTCLCRFSRATAPL